MNNLITIDLFVEDRAHEEFLKPLVMRIAGEEGVKISIHIRSARGGHGRAVSEFKLYQQLVEKRVSGIDPDLLIVAIDGNCTTFVKKRSEILNVATQSLSTRLIIACPDPHVERWYLADPDSFHDVIGYRPILGKKKCARHYYKDQLTSAIRSAGHTSLLGGIEFAPELVAEMNLYRAGKNEPSLGALIDELRGRFRQAGGK